MKNHTTEELGLGLIGVGRHGSRYAQHIQRDLPEVTLAALCRRKVDERQPWSGIPLYRDYRDMIADPSVGAIVVVTPPSLCRDICLEAVRARKPILIEKPLAMTGADARTMVDAASKAGVMLMTAQTMRFDPTILLLKQELQKIGALRSATFTSHIETKPNLLTGTQHPVAVGALLELGIHLLDLVRFLTEDEIEGVQCTMVPPSKITPEREVSVSLRMTKGITCRLDIARVDSERVGCTDWIGSEGTVSADWTKRTVGRRRHHGEPKITTVEPSPTVLATLQSFVHAIRTGTTPPITGVDGCRAVEAADACYQSAQEGGRWVRLAASG